MRLYRLMDAQGRPYTSQTPGRYGGNKRLKIYGRLDCPSALRWIARGHYVKNRVFFADAFTAQAAGYRPCGVCLKDEYKKWKSRHSASRFSGCYV